MADEKKVRMTAKQVELQLGMEIIQLKQELQAERDRKDIAAQQMARLREEVEDLNARLQTMTAEHTALAKENTENKRMREYYYDAHEALQKEIRSVHDWLDCLPGILPKKDPQAEYDSQEKNVLQRTSHYIITQLKGQ